MISKLLLLLSETWYTSDTPTAVLNDIAPPGYAALNVPRPLVAGGPTRGGGVAAVYRESLVVRRHPLADDFNPVTFELQLLRVGLPPSSHVVVNIYRPQWMSTVSAFVNELADVIAALAAGSSDNIIVCGDLNCPGVDVLHPDDKLTDVFDSFGMSQLVRSPTRDDNVLDVLASGNPTAVFDVKVCDAGHVSDHRLITASVVVRTPRPKTRYTARNIKAVDPSKFEEALRASVLFSNHATTVDAFVEQLEDVVTETLDRMAPIRTGVRRLPKSTSRWLSQEAVAAKRVWSGVG